ncbi:MAG: hypothetical protein EBZ78_03860 [Verrucomicrobia bacterium]|nr:hypothetical protein [Verrucomicrobiota bacterium]
MLVHHIDHPVTQRPQKKEGADQKKDSRVISTVSCSKKKRGVQKNSATLIPSKRSCSLVCVNLLIKIPFMLIITLGFHFAPKNVAYHVFKLPEKASPSTEPLGRKYILKKVQPFPKNQL